MALAVGEQLTITEDTDIQGSGFADASHNSNGGAIHLSNKCSVTLTVCTFTNCRADGSGGAIAISSDCVLTMTDCQFTTCTSGILGGAVYCTGGRVSATGGSFTDCSAPKGDVVYGAKESDCTLTNVAIKNCQTGTADYTVHIAETGTLTYNGGTITNCKAVRSILCVEKQYPGQYTVSDLTFDYNTLTSGSYAHGFVSIDAVGGVIYNNCKFDSANENKNGGFIGLEARTGAVCKVIDCVFNNGNYGAKVQGVICVSNSNQVLPSLELERCTFTKLRLDTTFIYYRAGEIGLTCDNLRIVECTFDDCPPSLNNVYNNFLLARGQTVLIVNSKFGLSCENIDDTPPLRFDAKQVDIMGTLFNAGVGNVEVPMVRMYLDAADVNFYNCCFECNREDVKFSPAYLDIHGWATVTCSYVCFRPIPGNTNKSVTYANTVTFNCPEDAFAEECECWSAPPPEPSPSEEETTETEELDVFTSDEQDTDTTTDEQLDPSDKPLEPSDKPDESGSGSGESGQGEGPGSKAGLIAGVTIGVIIVIAVVVVLVFFLLRRKNYHTDNSPTGPEELAEETGPAVSDEDGHVVVSVDNPLASTDEVLADNPFGDDFEEPPNAKGGNALWD